MRAAWYRFAAVSCLVVLIGFVSALFLSPNRAHSDTTTPLTGWAWSDTIGWISVSCSDLNTCGTVNYGLTMNANGTLSGMAWSDSIGWISANPTDLAGCPSAPCSASVQSGNASGWLRALAAAGAGSGGWDGWISLSGSGYGVTYDKNSGNFDGYAWEGATDPGGAIVGWVDFSRVHASPLQCKQLTYCKTSTQECTIHADCSPETCRTCVNNCVNNTCYVPIPGGTFTAVPSLVPQGGTSLISWDIINVKGCTVNGDNQDGPWHKEGDSNNEASSSHMSNAIVKQTTYTLDCTDLDNQAPDYIRTLIVNIVPKFQEK
jgi:hypothetical protein